MGKNIFFQYLSWQFVDVPRNLLKAWGNFLEFNLNYFSITLLLKTFFSPWRRYSWSYGKGFDLGKFFETFFSNLISRILGALMRLFLIIFGIIAEIFIFVIGIIVIFGWIILPFLVIGGFILGVKLCLT
ncbi:MAG: hypothetical protein WC514_02305 [Candidatus Paceibacterota bacterium]